MRNVEGNIEIITIFSTNNVERIKHRIKQDGNLIGLEMPVNALLKLPVKKCEKQGCNCEVMEEKLDIVYEM